jgi:hypothetical protein
MVAASANTDASEMPVLAPSLRRAPEPGKQNSPRASSTVPSGPGSSCRARSTARRRPLPPGRAVVRTAPDETLAWDDDQQSVLAVRWLLQAPAPGAQEPRCLRRSSRRSLPQPDKSIGRRRAGGGPGRTTPASPLRSREERRSEREGDRDGLHQQTLLGAICLALHGAPAAFPAHRKHWIPEGQPAAAGGDEAPSSATKYLACPAWISLSS